MHKEKQAQREAGTEERRRHKEKKTQTERRRHREETFPQLCHAFDQAGWE